MRLARELCAEGDAVVFVAPHSAAVLFADSPARHVAVEPMAVDLEGDLTRLVRKERCDTLTLVDATSVFLGFEEVGADVRVLERLDIPLVALDCWNLPEAGLRWDYGIDAMAIPERARDLPRRLVPVPVARPGTPGGFCALPSVRRLSAAERADARRALGVEDAHHLVLTTSSRFQEPDVHIWSHHKRLARHFPALLGRELAAVGPAVRLLHVGPSAWALEGTLGDRYRWLGQVEPGRFQELLGAADLLLSFNTPATTTIAAIAGEVPVVLGINSRRGRTVEEVEGSLDKPASDALRAWLRLVVPLYPFRLLPLGLFELLSPVLFDNPYQDALRTVELLEEGALAEACGRLLADAGEAGRLRGRQRAYVEEVRRLPTAGQVFRSFGV